MEASSTFLSESNNLLLSNLGFDELLALADAAWAHSNASLPASNHDYDDGLSDHQDPSTFTLKSHCMDYHDHLSLDQHSIIIHHNPQDAGTSCTGCGGTATSQVAPPIPDNGTRDERRQAAALQINMEEKDQGLETNNVSAEKIDNNGTPHSKEGEGQPKTTHKPVSPKPVQSNNDQNGKRLCVRKKMLNKNSASPTLVTIESTKEVMPKSAARSLNFDKEARRESFANKENATGNLGKRTGAIVQEMNAGLSFELNSSMNQALNSYKSLPEYTQAPRTSLESNPPGANPKDNPTGKIKNVRRKSLDKPSAPTTEVTGEMTTEKMPEFAKPPCKNCINFDEGAREESSAVQENATVHLGKETVVTQEMNTDLACDVNTSMKPASNSYMSLTEDTQARNTPSRRKPHGAKPKESPTSKKYVRRSGLNKSSTPTEMSGDLIREMMPKSAKTSCRKSLNFDKGARDESSADREMEVGLAYDLNTCMKQAENDHMSFPDEQAPSTSPSKRNPPGAKPKENPTGKRKYARKKILNNSPTPPTEMAGELTEAMMPESKEMSRRMSSNFDIGTKDESYTGRGILNEHVGNVAVETPVGLANHQDTWIQHALKSYISLPEYTQAPITSSKSNPPGAKPKESPTVKRKYVRKKRVNKTYTPTEMTGELTEPIMSESTTISCRSSLNFDNGGKGESNTCRESPACEQNTSVKATLYMPSSENTQAPSTSLSKSNPTGAKQKADSADNKKRKGLTTVQDGNIHNSQTSTIRSQGVGSKRKNSGTIKCADNLSSAESLFPTEAASANSGPTQPGNDNGLKNLFVSSIRHDNSSDPHEKSDNACCGKRTSQDTPLTPDNAITAESRQITSMQINMEEEKDRGGEEKNVPANKLDNDGTPPNKELCDPVIEFAAVSSPSRENQNLDTGSSHTDMNKTPQQQPRRKKHRPKVIIEGKPKRTRKPVTPKRPIQSTENPTGKSKYVRRKGLNKTSTTTEVTGESTEEMPESAKRSLKFDIEAIDEISAGRENTTAPLGKENGVFVHETNVGPAYELNTSITQASNSFISLPEDTQVPNTSSQRKRPGPKPKDNPTGKRKYGRRKSLDKPSAPTTEVIGEMTREKMPKSAKTSCRRSLNFDKGARDESSADKEMEVGLAYDLNTCMKQAESDHMSFPDEPAPSTSPSKRNPRGAKPKENPSGKQRYARRKILNNSPTPPTEMAGELTEAMMPESKEMSRRMSSNFDIGTKDESYTGRGILNVHTGNMAEETPVGLAYNQDTWIQHVLKSYISLPEYTQAPITSSKSNPPGAKPKESPTVKRKYVREKRLNKSYTAMEMTGELTEPIMSESTTISCRSSLNFDTGTRVESSAGRENLNVHISKENRTVVEQPHASHAHDQNTLVKQPSYNYMLPARASPCSKSNPLGEKPNANSARNKDERKGLATVQDGKTSNSQISTRLQMVGSNRTYSGNVKHADNSSMNLVGAHHNGLPSFQSKFRIQFPNIKKKRRIERGESSNNYVTSSVPSRKEARLTCHQEDAQVHPYGSSNRCQIYGSGNNAAKDPAITESVTDGTQTFTGLLRIVTERSRRPTQIYDYASLTRIRNCEKQVGTSDKETQRPQTCIDDLVAETRAPLSKKNQNRRKIALSSSAHSSTKEMQGHHSFALGNYHLPVGKSVVVSREVTRKTVQTIDALAEQFRQLDINIEARDLAFHKHTAPVLCEQPCPWRWHHQKKTYTWSLNFDKGARHESSADKENGKRMCVREKILNTNSTSPKSKPSEEMPKEIQAGQRKYVRRTGLNKIHNPPSEVTGTEAMVLEQDKSSSVKQALYNHMTLPEVVQTPSTFFSQRNHPWAKPKENPTGKRKYVRRKGLKNKTPTSTPSELTGELAEPMMPESTKISCRRSLHFDKGTRDESNACRENLNVHISKENRVVVEETHASLAHDQNTLVKQSLYNYVLLNANSVGNKDERKGLATVQDGNTSNSQISLQMVGSNRKKSDNIKHADSSSMNLVGEHYNGLPLYQTKFAVQFPNIFKKKRTERGKICNTCVTSSVPSRKEARLTCPQEDAQVHPYASRNRCQIYGSGNNATKVPSMSESTESVFDNTQTFTELLRRVTERSRPPTRIRDHSLTRIRSCKKQIGISDQETFGNAQRPQTCIDDLVAETYAPLTKKNQNRRKSSLSSSAHSSTKEMQRHHSFALGNYQLLLGKSVDVSLEVTRKTVRTVDVLAEKFRQLDMNIEARDLAFHRHNTPVLCEQPYPWRWHHLRPE